MFNVKRRLLMRASATKAFSAVNVCPDPTNAAKTSKVVKEEATNISIKLNARRKAKLRICAENSNFTLNF